ncbi:MAG: ubiquinol-cytochrome c reductase iron-sulfur subunit [Chloroflexi bacterium]|nr:ubiquinol-cytochrome c reductase iron-sulfur subunit [Chloroflexota bacterium]
MGVSPEGGEVSRRRLIAQALGAIGAFFAGIIGIPLIRFITFPIAEKIPEVWSEVGPVSDFPEGQVKLADISPVYKQLLSEDPGKRTVYVLHKGNGEFVCYHFHCTHVGCPVRWVEGAQRFFSPCHGGVFDKDGRVLAGPPPRPLDRHEVKVENGILYAGAIYQVNEKLERVKQVR